MATALRALGYEEGRNLRIEWRWGGERESLDTLARDLVSRRVELIVARTNESIQAAIRATRTIPIVMMNASFPEELGLVKSLAHPGGNVTGTSYSPPEFVAKLLELLREASRQVNRIAVPLFTGPSHPTESVRLRQLNDACHKLGMRVAYVPVPVASEALSALKAHTPRDIQALLFFGTPPLRAYQAQIAQFAIERKLMSIGTISTFTPVGGLFDYSPSNDEYFGNVAICVDRILKGAHPRDIPVQQPSRYELAVNMRTARSIGASVPQSILARADRVIE